MHLKLWIDRESCEEGRWIELLLTETDIAKPLRIDSVTEDLYKFPVVRNCTEDLQDLLKKFYN
jgi:hypothetical protein